MIDKPQLVVDDQSKDDRNGCVLFFLLNGRGFHVTASAAAAAAEEANPY